MRGWSPSGDVVEGVAFSAGMSVDGALPGHKDWRETYKNKGHRSLKGRKAFCGYEAHWEGG